MAYKAPDGTLLPSVPEDLDLLEQCEVGLACSILLRCALCGLYSVHCVCWLMRATEWVAQSSLPRHLPEQHEVVLPGLHPPDCVLPTLCVSLLSCLPPALARRCMRHCRPFHHLHQPYTLICLST